MKTVWALAAAVLGTLAAGAAPTDTVVVVDGKRIELTESDERIKVKVFDADADGDTVESRLLFEGHYGNGRRYERRSHFRSVNVPIPSWNRRGFNPHWAGFGMAFVSFSDGQLSRINDVGGLSLRSGSSLEYTFNIWEEHYLLSSKSSWAVVTGMGMTWSRYRIEGNHYLAETDGVTSLHPAPQGTAYSSSRLNITSITIPILLEWQNRRKGSVPLFFSAGVVGSVKTASSSRVTYRDGSGKNKNVKMDGGMNLRPVTVHILLQAGLNHLGLYAKYSPMQLFEGGKGPEVYPVALGLMFHF
ncbi:MAG: PorT family protein [Tannerellaceae bacterium]|nr:PorT family protein [Tannerellaceae bacterium]